VIPKASVGLYERKVGFILGNRNTLTDTGSRRPSERSSAVGTTAVAYLTQRLF
jgi:hypothetical protein